MRIQKVLETANVKVASVLSDILTQSGRAMLAAIVAGEDDPERLADLAKGNARKKRAQLVDALRAHVTPRHRTMIRLHLDLNRAIETTLEEVDDAGGKALEPISHAAELHRTIPGHR